MVKVHDRLDCAMEKLLGGDDLKSGATAFVATKSEDRLELCQELILAALKAY